MGKEFKSHNPRLSPRQRTEVHSTAAEVRGPDRGDKGSNGGKDKTQKRVSRLKRRLFSLCAEGQEATQWSPCLCYGKEKLQRTEVRERRGVH